VTILNNIAFLQNGPALSCNRSDVPPSTEEPQS